jgi:multiple sugar transport system permease protein
VFPTIFGILIAVILDREMRGSRFYQTAFYLPVVLSLALVGFIWQLFYSTDQGLINAVFGSNIDWYGDPTSTCGRCSSPRRGGTPATSCCSTWPA